MRRSLIALCLLGIGYALFTLAIWRLSDGFNVRKIKSELSYSSEWEVANPPTEAVRFLLAQNFYYIGKGSQCYVFESEDKDIVLKFFRHPRYRLAKFNKFIVEPAFLASIRDAKQRAKDEKLHALFQSCKLAFEELREESQLLYLHLNKTQNLKQQVVLVDKLKRSFTINSDEYEFMIQKRGEQIYPYLSRLIEKGKKQEAKEALKDLVTVLTSRVLKTIADQDPVVHKNAGFRGKKALFLDVGGFSKQEEVQDLCTLTLQLRQWLQQQDPELAAYMETLCLRLAI